MKKSDGKIYETKAWIHIGPWTQTGIQMLNWTLIASFRPVKGFVMGADEAKQRLKAYAAWKTGNMGLMLPNKKKVGHNKIKI